MLTLPVELAERAYTIHIGRGLLRTPVELAKLIKPHIRGRQVAIITNATVNRLYGEPLCAAVREALGGELQVDLHEIGDGEAFKNLQTFTEALDFLVQRRHNRTTCVIALGGGVVGDLAGFVAATYQRGVDFLQVPTTLLSQVDSSVGGKTAVNHPLGKNLIGAFYQPKAVIIDTDVLHTLPEREFAAGLAEVVKYGVIADAEFFAWMEANVNALNEKDPGTLEYAIKRSCEVKADIVAKDERENGLRAILNYGHTFGHAIENLSGYGTWLHGEAVAVGMVMAHRFAERIAMLNQGSSERLVNLLHGLHLPTGLQGGVTAAALEDAMGLDKKAVDGRVRLVLASQLGTATLVDQYDAQALRSLLEEFC